MAAFAQVFAHPVSGIRHISTVTNKYCYFINEINKMRLYQKSNSEIADQI
jgi:hypothetical protein